jgi:tetratricopeptide (TPR) repeat protein
MSEAATTPDGAAPAVSPEAGAPVTFPQPSPAGWASLRAGIAASFRRPWRVLAILALLGCIAYGITLAGANFWALYHFRAARSADRLCHTAQAQEHLQACMKVWPRDADTLLLAARTARRAGAFEEAEEFLDQYKQLRGGSDDQLTQESVLLRAERGEIDQVAKYCQTVVDEGRPGWPLVLEAVIRGNTRMFRLSEAAGLLEMWRKRDPDSAEAHLLQGVIEQLRQARQEALGSFRRALEIDPEHDEARMHLVDLLLEMAQGGEALPHARYLQQRQPDNVILLVYLARCLDLAGEQAEAEKTLDRVLELDPRHAAALFERGKLALRSGQVEAAEKWLRQAAEADPGDYQIHYQFNQCLTELHKTEEARQEQLRLKQIEDDVTRLEEILRRMQKSAEDAHDASLQYQAGMIAMRSGQVKEAVRWFRSAVREDPRNAPAHRALADYYERTGQRTLAHRHREMAAAADPTPPARGAAPPSKP